MEAISKSKTYLKEYPCYHFTLTNNIQTQINKKYNIQFYQNNHPLATLPSALVDEFDQKPTLYLLNWQSEDSK